MYVVCLGDAFDQPFSQLLIEKIEKLESLCKRKDMSLQVRGGSETTRLT